MIGLLLHSLRALYFWYMTPSSLSLQFSLPGLGIAVPPHHQICSIFDSRGYDLCFVHFILMFCKQLLVTFRKLVVSRPVLQFHTYYSFLLLYFWQLKIRAHIVYLALICASLCSPQCQQCCWWQELHYALLWELGKCSCGWCVILMSTCSDIMIR